MGTRVPKDLKEKVNKVAKTPKKIVEKTVAEQGLELAIETINNQLKEIEYWKEAVASARNGEEHYLKLFDEEAKINEAMRDLVINTISRLKGAFRMGLANTGEITIEDIDYNLDLLPRFVEHKFFKEEKKDY